MPPFEQEVLPTQPPPPPSPSAPPRRGARRLASSLPRLHPSGWPPWIRDDEGGRTACDRIGARPEAHQQIVHVSSEGFKPRIASLALYYYYRPPGSMLGYPLRLLKKRTTDKAAFVDLCILARDWRSTTPGGSAVPYDSIIAGGSGGTGRVGTALDRSSAAAALKEPAGTTTW